MTDFDKEAMKDLIHRDAKNLEASIRERAARGCRPGQSKSSQDILWGLLICTAGVMLLLDHLGIVASGRIWTFWPVVVMVWGATYLFQVGNRAWGLILMVTGVLFQLSNLNIIRFRWADFWPLAIIAVGAKLIWNAMVTRRLGGAIEESSTNATAIFGAVERRITARDFRFAKVSAVFGGVELDFRDADIAGNEAVLQVDTVFGGIEIHVPDAWQVQARNQTIFGGFSDSRRPPAIEPPEDQKKTLIVRGSVIFGGVEIKN